MKDYVAEICEMTATNDLMIDLGRMPLSRSYQDGVVVAPVDYEIDEFSGVWFVQLGVALNRRFAVFRLDLGQARFRIDTEFDVRHPKGLTKNEAQVKRDDLIEALATFLFRARKHRGFDAVRAGPGNLHETLSGVSA